jgi:hypothetical protein
VKKSYKNSIFISAVVVSLFCGCTKDREFESTIVQPPANGEIGLGTLVINELLATGSTLANPDFPAIGPSDWLEIYNPGNDTVFIESGRWLVSDSIAPGQNDETTLYKDTIIPPKTFLIIQCDSQDSALTQYHTAFNLSKDGEAVGLFYLKDDGTYITIDSHTYGPQTSGTSEGRSPDGSSNWTKPLNPTPGASNP